MEQFDGSTSGVEFSSWDIYGILVHAVLKFTIRILSNFCVFSWVALACWYHCIRSRNKVGRIAPKNLLALKSCRNSLATIHVQLCRFFCFLFLSVKLILDILFAVRYFVRRAVSQFLSMTDGLPESEIPLSQTGGYSAGHY
jgi:hypothetical protein